jgi:MFS family permease
MLAEVFTACTGGAVLTGSALHYGASPLSVGAVVAAPQLAQVMHLPAAWLTGTFGARRVAIVAVLLSRQAMLPLAALPFLPIGEEAKLSVLSVVVALSAVLGIIGNNGWTAWMGDVVPGALRGRYFGKRTAACTLAGSVASLCAGVVLDAAGASMTRGYVLAALAVLGCIAGALTTHLMIAQGGENTPRPFALGAAFAPLADRTARSLFTYALGWNAAVGLAGSFFAMHMLKYLRMGFVLIALHAAALAIARIIACPVWGRVIDRYGSRPVLTACSYGICVLPAIYLFATPDRLWPLAFDAILAGVLWSGHSLATFSLPLAITTREERPLWLALNSTGAGLAFAAGTLVAGTIAEALPDEVSVLGQPLVRLHVLFGLSALARVFAAALAPRIIEPGAAPALTLLRAVPTRIGELARVVIRG